MAKQPQSDELTAHVIELEQKLAFQQRAFDELNAVVLEQQGEIETLRRELKSLRGMLQGISERGTGEDLPHEKPPHY